MKSYHPGVVVIGGGAFSVWRHFCLPLFAWSQHVSSVHWATRLIWTYMVMVLHPRYHMSPAYS